MKDLKKILDLLRKTGERFLLADDDDNFFIILSAADYENLLLKHSEIKDFSEEELLNKINKDVAIWKAAQEDEKLLADWQNLNPEIKKDANEEKEDQYYFEPVEDEE